MKKILRDYQEKLANAVFEKLKNFKFCYLQAEVRVGKTLVALESARLFSAKKVIFITKKNAIDSINKDYVNFCYNIYFNLTVVNTESLHKIKENFDLVISDEHHKYGAFPKPSERQKIFKEMFKNTPIIALSGTPCPESYSQLFHQLNISVNAPFYDYLNFYRWADIFVNVKKRKLPHGTINDYSNAYKHLIDPLIDKFFVKFTQKEAGFEAEINERIIFVKMKKETEELAQELIKNRVVICKKGKEILAESPVKLMQKCHQIYSGTIKYEDGSSDVLDTSKVEKIKEIFKDQKIAIFYKFKAELDAIRMVMDVTTSIEEFKKTDKSIALQILAGREGVNLSEAEALVFYNIDFSALSYWQARARLMTQDRKNNNIYWVFSESGIEKKIYETVLKKKSYTSSMFLQNEK